MKTNKIINWLSALLVAALVMTTSCNMDHDFLAGVTEDVVSDMLERDPELVMGFLAAAIGTLGDEWSNHDAAHIMSLQHAGDLMTEDMVMRRNDWHFFDYDIADGNNLANFRRPTHSWRMMYSVIGRVNQAIDLIDPETENAVLQNVLGQSLALRAFSYHILIQRFQHAYTVNREALGVPVVLSTRENAEGQPSRFYRVPVYQVYEQIVNDLQRAVGLLGDARTSTDFINRAVAQGFLARAFMNLERWAEAEEMAAAARANFPLLSLEAAGTINYGVQAGNSEWMWGLNGTAENTRMFASFQSHMASDGNGYAGWGGNSSFKAMDNRLYHQMGENDVRRKLHHMDEENDEFWNLKFRDVPNWLMDNIYMRASEMLLIEAEAQARQGNNAQAATTLMELMSRRDPDFNITSATIEDVFLQKRLEMWGEGVIFYDNRRFERDIDRVYTEPRSNHLVQLHQSGRSWLVIYQIPRMEIDQNPYIDDEDQNDANPAPGFNQSPRPIPGTLRVGREH